MLSFCLFSQGRYAETSQLHAGKAIRFLLFSVTVLLQNRRWVTACSFHSFEATVTTTAPLPFCTAYFSVDLTEKRKVHWCFPSSFLSDIWTLCGHFLSFLLTYPHSLSSLRSPSELITPSTCMCLFSLCSRLSVCLQYLEWALAVSLVFFACQLSFCEVPQRAIHELEWGKTSLDHSLFSSVCSGGQFLST